MLSGHAPILQYLAVYPYRTLAFQETDYTGKAVFGRNPNTHVNMVDHQMPFQNFDSPLIGQFTQDRAYLAAHLPVQPPYGDTS